MIKVATALGNKLAISAKNCDFGIHNSNFLFNINGKALIAVVVLVVEVVVIEIVVVHYMLSLIYVLEFCLYMHTYILYITSMFCTSLLTMFIPYPMYTVLLLQLLYRALRRVPAGPVRPLRARHPPRNPEHLRNRQHH